MIGPLLFLYAMVGVVTAAMSFAVLDDHPIGPPGSEPAIRFVIGLLWPLAIVGAVLFGLLALGGSVVMGFVVLWRAWRPTRLPKATATDRRDP
jgi:hypothetical protein